MPKAANFDWIAMKAEYCQNPHLSKNDLALKHKVNIRTVERRAKADGWSEGRREFGEDYARRLSAAAVSHGAVNALRKLNDSQLKQSEELRYMLNARLKTRTPDGKIVPRADVTITDISRAIAGFEALYRLDRLALGASTDNIQPASTRESRLMELSDDELLSELKRVRAESPYVQ
jgi:hypothetical protein